MEAPERNSGGQVFGPANCPQLNIWLSTGLLASEKTWLFNAFQPFDKWVRGEEGDEGGTVRGERERQEDREGEGTEWERQ